MLLRLRLLERQRWKAGDARLEGWKAGGLEGCWRGFQDCSGKHNGKLFRLMGNNHLAELERGDLGIHQSLVETSGGAPETSFVGPCPKTSLLSEPPRASHRISALHLSGPPKLF